MSRIQTRRNISVSASFFERLTKFTAARGVKHTTFVERELRKMLDEAGSPGLIVLAMFGCAVKLGRITVDINEQLRIGSRMRIIVKREDPVALARWADDGGSHVESM